MDAIWLLALVAAVQGQDAFVFPGAEEDAPGQTPPRLQDARIPVLIPGRCPPNQLLYPGDQKTDWVCDCGAGHIYYPDKDGCFAAYRQGPCSANQYLILPKGKVIPACLDNPCRTDGFVKFQGECHELGKSGGPCGPANQGGGVLGVNITTLDLQCLTDTARLSLINFPPNCPPGSKRGASCKTEYRRK